MTLKVLFLGRVVVIADDVSVVVRGRTRLLACVEWQMRASLAVLLLVLECDQL